MTADSLENVSRLANVNDLSFFLEHVNSGFAFYLDSGHGLDWLLDSGHHKPPSLGRHSLDAERHAVQLGEIVGRLAQLQVN